MKIKNRKQKGSGCSVMNYPNINVVPPESEMNKVINEKCIQNYYTEYLKLEDVEDDSMTPSDFFKKAQDGDISILETLAGLNNNSYIPHEQRQGQPIDEIDFELQLQGEKIYETQENYEDYRSGIKKKDHNLKNSIQFSRYLINPSYWDKEGGVLETQGFPSIASTRGIKWDLVLKGDVLCIIFRGSCYDEGHAGNFHSSPLINVQRIAKLLDIEIEDKLFEGIKTTYTIDEVNSSDEFKTERKKINGDVGEDGQGGSLLKERIKKNFSDKDAFVNFEEQQNQVWYEELFTPAMSSNYARVFLYINNRLKGSNLPYKIPRTYLLSNTFGGHLDGTLSLAGFPDIMGNIQFDEQEKAADPNKDYPPVYNEGINKSIHETDWLEQKSFHETKKQRWEDLCMNKESHTRFVKRSTEDRNPIDEASKCLSVEQDLFFKDIISIDKALKEQKGESTGLKGIVISGHSRGGGMSFISSFFIKNHKDLKDIPVVTLPFAPVRTGNYLFGELYNKLDKSRKDISARFYLDWDDTATTISKDLVNELVKAEETQGGTRRSKKKGGDLTDFLPGFLGFEESEQPSSEPKSQITVVRPMQLFQHYRNQGQSAPMDVIMDVLGHQVNFLKYVAESRHNWENQDIWKNYLSSPVNSIFLDFSEDLKKLKIRIGDRNDMNILSEQEYRIPEGKLQAIYTKGYNSQNENVGEKEKGAMESLMKFFTSERNKVNVKEIYKTIKRPRGSPEIPNQVQGGGGAHSIAKLATVFLMMNKLKESHGDPDSGLESLDSIPTSLQKINPIKESGEEEIQEVGGRKSNPRRKKSKKSLRYLSNRKISRQNLRGSGRSKNKTKKSNKKNNRKKSRKN